MNELMSLSDLLTSTTQARPVLAEALSQYGDMSLYHYMREVSGRDQGKRDPMRSLYYEQFVTVAVNMCRHTLGENVARRLEKQLNTNNAVLTGNHHGPEWFYVTIQGMLAYAFGLLYNNDDVGVEVVLAFSDIPQNNITHPRGMIIGNQRLSIFPDREKSRLVIATPRFTRDMIDDGESKSTALNKLSELPLHPKLRETAGEVLRQIYLDEQVLNQPDYTSQITIINNKLWPWLFSKEVRHRIPEMVYLPIERIVSQLLINHDLNNVNSLVYQVMFEPQVRESVLQSLNGVYGCWDNDKINALHTNYLQHDHLNARENERHCGTVFFWGIDNKGKRYPFILELTDGGWFLKGVTMRGETIKIPWEKGEIINALKNEQIIPSLFTTFLVLAFQRGVKCFGGFNQIQYLTEMKEGLSKALDCLNMPELAGMVMNTSTINYCTGMTMIVVLEREGDKDRDRSLTIRPAGTLDILAYGGLKDKDIIEMGSLPVKDAIYLSLPSIYEIIFNEKPPVSQLDIYRLIKDNLVSIELQN